MTDPKKYNSEVCPDAPAKIVDAEEGQRNCTVCGRILQKDEMCEQERDSNPANG